VTNTGDFTTSHIITQQGIQVIIPQPLEGRVTYTASNTGIIFSIQTENGEIIDFESSSDLDTWNVIDGLGNVFGDGQVLTQEILFDGEAKFYRIKQVD